MTLPYILATLLPLIAAAVLFAFYSRDHSQRFFVGKTLRIPGVSGAKTLIVLSQFAVPAVVSLAIMRDDPWLLKLALPPALRVVGFACGACGLALFVLAKWQLGTSYTPCYHAFVPPTLIDHGVYRLIRHPIYTANLLLIWAGFLISASAWILVMFAAMAWMYRRTARIEETVLSQQLQGYRAYLQRTGRFLPKFEPQGLRQP